MFGNMVKIFFLFFFLSRFEFQLCPLLDEKPQVCLLTSLNVSVFLCKMGRIVPFMKHLTYEYFLVQSLHAKVKAAVVTGVGAVTPGTHSPQLLHKEIVLKELQGHLGFWHLSFYGCRIKGEGGSIKSSVFISSHLGRPFPPQSCLGGAGISVNLPCWHSVNESGGLG